MGKRLMSALLGLILLMCGLMPQQDHQVYASVDSQSICGGLLLNKPTRTLAQHNIQLIFPYTQQGQNFRSLLQQQTGTPSPNTIYGNTGRDIRSVTASENGNTIIFLSVSQSNENDRIVCVISNNQGVQYSPEGGRDPIWSELLDNFVIESNGKLITPRNSGGYLDLTQNMPGIYTMALEKDDHLYATRILNQTYMFGELRSNGSEYVFDPLLTLSDTTKAIINCKRYGIVVEKSLSNGYRGFYPVLHDGVNWEVSQSPLFPPGPVQAGSCSQWDSTQPDANGYLAYTNNQTQTYWILNFDEYRIFNTGIQSQGTAPVVKRMEQIKWEVYLPQIGRDAN